MKKIKTFCSANLTDKKADDWICVCGGFRAASSPIQLPNVASKPFNPRSLSHRLQPPEAFVCSHCDAWCAGNILSELTCGDRQRKTPSDSTNHLLIIHPRAIIDCSEKRHPSFCGSII